MTDKHNPQLRDAVRLGDPLFKVLAQLIAHKDKLDLTRIEIPENPWDFESAITRWATVGRVSTRRFRNHGGGKRDAIESRRRASAARDIRST